MKTKHIALAATAVLAVSGQVALADGSQPIWASHFETAYNGTPQQTQGSASSAARPSPTDALIWFSQFEQAYVPSSQATRVASTASRHNGTERLLWAVHFKEAYAPVREEGRAIEAVGQVAMDRR